MLKIIAFYFTPFVVITAATAIVAITYKLILYADKKIMHDKHPDNEKV